MGAIFLRGWMGSAILLAIGGLALLRPDIGGLLESSDASEPASVSAVVTRVIDGDTIEASFSGRIEDVRLIGIDTPETVKPDEPVQCFGPQASAFTHRLLEGATVRLTFGVEERDTYGRMLAYVRRGKQFVNATLVRRGFARTLTIPPNDRFAPQLRLLELSAARAGRGLWGSC